MLRDEFIVRKNQGIIESDAEPVLRKQGIIEGDAKPILFISETIKRPYCSDDGGDNQLELRKDGYLPAKKNP